MQKTKSWFKDDNVNINSWWGFDYCFCGGDCKNYKCGRNTESKSYKAMLKSEPVHSCADFTKECYDYASENYRMTEEELIKETLERR